MNVRLQVSERMTGGKTSEGKCVRIPRRARLYFDSNRKRMVLSVNDKSIALAVKPAYKEDIQILTKQLEVGKITEEQACMTAFVTTDTMQSLAGRRRGGLEEHSFITDGVENLMIGADPEFALAKPEDEQLQYAQYVKSLPTAGELGSDGPLAEVRPAPSTEVSEVVKNIADIFHKHGEKMIGDFLWVAGATYSSPNSPNERVVHMGGHLHLGNPKLLNEDQKIAVYKRIIRALDETIALPLVRIDCPLPHLRRNTAHNGYGRYGRYGDQRPQLGRFEWRVPSGLWLAHPDMTQAVMGVTKAVTESCYQMMAEVEFDTAWINAAQNRKGFLKTWGAMDAHKVEKMVNSADPEAVPVALLNRAAKKLRGLPNHDKYKAEIDEFVRLVKMSKKDRSRINLDLRDTWLNNGKLITGE